MAPRAAALQQIPVAKQLQGCLCLCSTRGAARVPLDCWRGAGSMETGAVAMAKSFRCWLAHGPAGKNAGARRRDTRWSRGWQEGRGEPAYVHSRGYKDSRSWQSRGHTPRRKEWERRQRHSAELKKKNRRRVWHMERGNKAELAQPANNWIENTGRGKELDSLLPFTLWRQLHAGRGGVEYNSILHVLQWTVGFTFQPLPFVVFSFHSPCLLFRLDSCMLCSYLCLLSDLFLNLLYLFFFLR